MSGQEKAMGSSWPETETHSMTRFPARWFMSLGTLHRAPEVRRLGPGSLAIGAGARRAGRVCLGAERQWRMAPAESRLSRQRQPPNPGRLSECCGVRHALYP